MAESEVKTVEERPSGRWMALDTLTARHRMLANIVVHTILFTLALFLAYMVRFEPMWGQEEGPAFSEWMMDYFLPLLPVFILLKLIIFGRLRLFRGGWQYASIRDITSILLGAWVFSVIMFITVWLLRDVPKQSGVLVPYVGEYLQKLPKSIVLLDFILTVFLVSTSRLGYRLYREELRPISSEGVRRVLIVGAGNAAEGIIREIHRMNVERYRVIGMVDDDPAKKGIFIHDVPLLGETADIRSICETHEVEEIIVAMPSATQKELRRVIDLCSGTKLKFQSLPGVADLIDGRVTVSQIRPVDINDLLGREAVELDWDAIGKFLRGRRVLITGAGGSIGSEMCRQICRFEPAQLILVEQAETPLFDIQNELRNAYPDLDPIARICDIYDRDRVMHLWDLHKPEVVIHAAAHKHVPLMEYNPCEAIKNNILGTKNCSDASCKYGASEFVMISTDKAVNPSSVMGASKRVAEMYSQALNGQADCKTQFKAVRFGNVLGSSGSVVPTFRRQIAAGGPVTVTDPEMTRYFMTIPEAAQLVLQAAATGMGGQVFLLDMGEPVKIVDLAKQMITLSGFRPDEDIDIVFTGVRPGEKLFEELRTEGEDIEPTVHPKVLIWAHRADDLAQVEAYISRLKELENVNDRDRIVTLLQEIIPEYKPLNPPTKTAKTPA